MRTLSADWMANTSKADPEQRSLHQETAEMRQSTFYPRPVAPTAAQVRPCAYLFTVTKAKWLTPHSTG
jgi:cytoplasmic FMR1 interacting protein